MKGRLIVFLVVMGLWAAGISARLVQLQVVEHENYLARARDQQQKTLELSPPRGTIFDAQGRRLAMSVAVDSAYVMPGKVENPREAARQIGAALGRPENEVLERLTDERRWLWLDRQLDPKPARALRELDLPGIGFVSESKRYYPNDSLAGPVLGFVGTDHSGLAGIEAAYDRVVSGEPVRRSLMRDALDGAAVAPGFSFMDAEPGADLYLTLDSTVQHIVEDELEKAMAKSQAKAAVAVVMNPRTGAIVAMASLPGFDPNRFGEYESSRWQNRAVEHAFEPGSTFKAVTTVAALEANLVDPMDVIDCEEGSITLGRSTRIGDHKPFGRLTFREVIAKSSNVGMIKVGLRIPRSDFYAQARDFGLGSSSGVDLPGENMGILRSADRWSRWEAAYLSIGQGLSVTAVQLVRAFAALANGGYLVEPHVVAAIERRGRREPIEHARRSEALASPSSLRSATRLLEGVVEAGGGHAAGVPGYRVAGKTGTAQKAVASGGYSQDRLIASFAGFVPSRDPELVGLVLIDEPQGLYYGGEVAAPVFGAIMARVLPYLGIPPNLETNPYENAPALEARVASGQRLARSRPTVAGAEKGSVPDVRGLTAREAIQKLAENGLTPKLHGSGFVETQSPPPGLPLARAQGQVEIWLAASAG